jgi:hypothetical protein
LAWEQSSITHNKTVECQKDESVYNRHGQFALDSLRHLALSKWNNDQCDFSHVIDVLAQYNWTWGMVGDSIVGQSFCGLECEMRGCRTYNFAMLETGYRLEQPEHFGYHAYGTNKIHRN